jgi:hypothetical protein
MMLTALVVSLVRHRAEGRGESWEGYVHFFASWFVHYLALWMLAAIAGIFICSWHKFFLDSELDFGRNIPQLLYYVTSVVLIASVAIWILVILPPGTFATD